MPRIRVHMYTRIWSEHRYRQTNMPPLLCRENTKNNSSLSIATSSNCEPVLGAGELRLSESEDLPRGVNVWPCDSSLGRLARAEIDAEGASRFRSLEDVWSFFVAVCDGPPLGTSSSVDLDFPRAIKSPGGAMCTKKEDIMPLNYLYFN